MSSLILREQFELSPREAEAIVAVANYDLKHYDPSSIKSRRRVPMLNIIHQIAVEELKNIEKEFIEIGEQQWAKSFPEVPVKL